jgi:large subunit ribosomal protein L25
LNLTQITAEKRSLGSKSYLKSLRAAGKVPGVLHGQDMYSLPITVDSIELKKAMSTAAGHNVLLDLKIEDDSKTAMIENLQRNVMKEGVYLHVDLMLVSLDKKIEVNIPITLVGQDKRASDDGIVAQPIHEIAIQSIPTAIPENIRIDISGLKIGDSILLRDITLPEGCEAITAADEMLVQIMPPRVSEEEAETESTEEATEPALIGDSKEEDS